MGIIIYGEKEIPIGMDEFLVACPKCETHAWADIMVVSHYFHVYYIPFFPTDKDANVICKTCEYKRYGAAFNQKLISNYEEVKNQYSHPWYTYFGLTIFAFLILLIIVAAIF